MHVPCHFDPVHGRWPASNGDASELDRRGRLVAVRVGPTVGQLRWMNRVDGTRLAPGSGGRQGASGEPALLDR